ncbi:hypothetical protein SELMODRAFT_422384 [Selaginella moellendorffii]|uniref:Uncharacterized protein n=1 Tax=Selaginella moellendorffii TaxID=88036 RepID=D8SI81_SELML|nr:hypothetical protein SELMODRAFT_422384 [Selaginella moellendorffii]
MVQDGWALAFFCDAPDVPIVLEGQSLPFMDYLSNSLVKPREGNPVQFQALLLPSLKSQLQGLYDISACKLGDNVSLDGAPFQALLLQGLYNISACNIPLDGAQFQALLLPSSKLQMQELYNISARMLGDKAYLDGTRAAASMVQESDAFLVIGSTVMVLRLVSAAHKGKTRADDIACFEMECAGEDLSPWWRDIFWGTRWSASLFHGTIGLAVFCKQGFIVLFDSLTTVTGDDGGVVEKRRNFKKIVEVRSEPRLRVGFAGNVAASLQVIKLLQVKLSRKELTLHEAAKFLTKKAGLYATTDPDFVASFFVYNESMLVMVKNDGNGYKTTELTNEHSVMAIGSGAQQAQVILRQPVRGQNHGKEASVGEALSLGLDAFAQACIENPECGGDLCVIDGSENVKLCGRKFKKVLARAVSDNFSFQDKKRAMQRNALNIRTILFKKEEEALTSTASAKDSPVEKVENITEVDGVVMVCICVVFLLALLQLTINVQVQNQGAFTFAALSFNYKTRVVKEAFTVLHDCLVLAMASHASGGGHDVNVGQRHSK